MRGGVGGMRSSLAECGNKQTAEGSFQKRTELRPQINVLNFPFDNRTPSMN